MSVRIELFRYDNRANPEDVDRNLEWGWRTQFQNVGIVARLGPATELKMQALDGRTRMGFVEPGESRRWVDNRFRSAFAMMTHEFGPVGLAIRGEAFETRNHGSDVDDEYDERGWSVMAAAKRQFGRFTGLVELLHVSSRREEQRTRQSQAQAELRMRW